LAINSSLEVVLEKRDPLLEEAFVFSVTMNHATRGASPERAKNYHNAIGTQWFRWLAKPPPFTFRECQFGLYAVANHLKSRHHYTRTGKLRVKKRTPGAGTPCTAARMVAVSAHTPGVPKTCAR